jgi:hypothetical protein
MADSFHVIAIIAAFNEVDIISPMIGHFVENGIEVYLIDNHSTDDTVAQARRWLGCGLLNIESFPCRQEVNALRAQKQTWEDQTVHLFGRSCSD